MSHQHGDAFELPSPQQVEQSTDVLYEFKIGGRRVVGLDGGIVVKYGANIDLEEANSTSFVSRNTNIPVPKILGTYTANSKNFIFMSRVQGKPLSESVHSLSAQEFDTIAVELTLCLDQLRALRIQTFEQSSYIGSIGHGECKDAIFRAGSDKRGPFSTELEMHSNICDRWLDLRSWGNNKTDNYIHILRRMYFENSSHEIRFTHGDLSPCNIMIHQGHVSGILDWQEAGWYPEYWEYVNAMGGCAGIWDTLWPLQIEKILQPYDYMRLIHQPVRAQLQ